MSRTNEALQKDSTFDDLEALKLSPDQVDELQRKQLPAVPEQRLPVADGWDDAASELNDSVIRGTLLKFADWKWTKGTETTEIKEGTLFVALGTAAGWVKWWGGKPVQYQMRQPGEPLCDREDLGDDDETLWEPALDGNGKRDPWANTRFVYLLDPVSVEMFTFTTSSWGGRAAVSILGDQIMRMRGLGHPDASPVVELGAAEMKTKFGRKSKPTFKIVKWYGGGGGKLKEIAPPSSEQIMDDGIPF